MSPNEASTLPNSTPKKRSTPAIVPLLLAGLFMVTGICALIIIGREKARIIGQSVTELDIQPLLNAESAITDDQMLGKVTVLHFWGFWCKDCVKELPDFVTIQRTYLQDNKVIFASIACSNRANETKDALRFYTNKCLQNIDANDLPIYYDPAEFSRSRISQLMTQGGFAYPTTLVLDVQGRVVDVWRQSIPPKALAKAIEKAKLINPTTN